MCNLRYWTLVLPIVCFLAVATNLFLLQQLKRIFVRFKTDFEYRLSRLENETFIQINYSAVVPPYRRRRSVEQTSDKRAAIDEDNGKIKIRNDQLVIPVRIPVHVMTTFCIQSELYCRRQSSFLKGDKGEPGLKGDKGHASVSGGYSGSVGLKGDKGEKGEMGYIGFSGAQGVVGLTGPQGRPGPIGPRGEKGAPGLPGLRGLIGPKGEKGDRGNQGVRGVKGRRGDIMFQKGCQNDSPPSIASRSRNNITKREKDCLLDWIGIPILVNEMRINNSIVKYGAWMKDQLPKTGDQQKYVYIANGNRGPIERNKIYEYENEKSISKRSRWRRIIELPPDYDFFGCGHIIVHGNFIFHRANTSTIVSANLNIGTNNDTVAEIVAEKHISDSSLEGSGLYQDARIGSFDFALYDGSIWVIYKTKIQDSNRLVVTKLARDTLEYRGVRYVVAIEPAILVNTFLAYGMLYGVQSYDDHTTYVQFAFDVVEGKTLTTVDLKLTVPYKSLAQLSYDPYTRRLYAWDDGRLIYYMYNVKVSQSKC
ncbi:hypothetical protein ACOME3_008917 [Neoechinorhynchus agilis]